MMGNIISGKLKFIAINTASFVVAAGAAGWVDTDVSATTGTASHRIWVVSLTSTAYGSVGARYHGDTVAPIVNTGRTNTLFSKVDASGHMDLYRDAAADNTYQIIGYFE